MDSKLEFPQGFRDPFDMSESLSDISYGSGRLSWSSMESIPHPLQTEPEIPRSSPRPIPVRTALGRIQYPDVVHFQPNIGPRIRPEQRSFSLPIIINQNDRNESIEISEEENNQVANYKPDRVYTMLLTICLFVFVYWLLTSTKSTRN